MSSPIDPDRPGGRQADRPADAGSNTPPVHLVRSTKEIAEYSAFYRDAVPRLTAHLVVAEGASKAQAAECTHEALVELLRRWKEVDHPLAWCRKAARNIFLKRLYSATESFDDLPATGAPLYAEDHERHEQRDRVLPLLRELPPRQRQITALVLEGYSIDEIAEELDTAPATVRSNVRHATQRLVVLLSQRETTEEGS